LVGGVEDIQDLIKTRIAEARNGPASLVCVVGERCKEWLSADFLRGVAQDLEQSQAKGVIKFKQQLEEFKADQLPSYEDQADTWASLTWRLPAPATFLTTEASSCFTLVLVASLPLFEAKSVHSNLEQLRTSVKSVTHRRLRCLETSSSVALAFQPVSVQSVLDAVATTGRINRSFYTYRPSSASKQLAWRYRTQLSTLEDLTSVPNTRDNSSLSLRRLSRESEQLKEVTQQTSQPYTSDLKASELNGINFENYSRGRLPPSQPKAGRLPPRPKSRDCSMRAVKYRGKVLRPATNYNRRRQSLSKLMA
jgi:hypothetical protein